MSEEARNDSGEGRVLSVHVGQSASCSSIGSVVDFLFVSSVIGAAVVSGVTLLLLRRRAELTKGDGGAPDKER